MIKKLMITGRKWIVWNGCKISAVRYEEEYLIPMDTTAVSQWEREVNHLNRMLPIGHRVRGDVA